MMVFSKKLGRKQAVLWMVTYGMLKFDPGCNTSAEKTSAFIKTGEFVLKLKASINMITNNTK